MRKLIHIIIILLFAACSSYTGHHEIIVNKTVKVFSKEYHNKSEDYIFKWNPPIGPNNKVIPFDLKDDMLLFTPIQVGDYQIHLSITNISNEIIAEEMSQGKGLFLADYARILGCSERSVVDFSTITQKQTKNIFMKRDDAKSILLRTQKIINDNSALSQSCSS